VKPVRGAGLQRFYGAGTGEGGGREGGGGDGAPASSDLIAYSSRPVRGIMGIGPSTVDGIDIAARWRREKRRWMGFSFNEVGPDGRAFDQAIGIDHALRLPYCRLPDRSRRPESR